MPRSFLSLDNQKIDEGFSELPCFARHAPATIRFTPNFPRTALRKAGRRWREAPDEGLRETRKVRTLSSTIRDKILHSAWRFRVLSDAAAPRRPVRSAKCLGCKGRRRGLGSRFAKRSTAAGEAGLTFDARPHRWQRDAGN